MRKDMILGMSIGGMVLAIVVVYLTISPSHKPKTVVQLDTGNGTADGQGDNDPQIASDRGNDSAGPALPRLTAHSGTDSGSDATGTPDGAPAPSASRRQGGGSQGDHEDPIWGPRLNGGGTPLMGVAQTPGSDPIPAAPTRDTVARLDHPLPVPGEISTGSLNTGGTPAATPTTHPAGAVVTGNGKYTPHRVQPGETFSSISLAAYGSASYFPHILRANPGLDPRKLKPNMVINLPLESQVKPAEAPVTEQTFASVPPGMPATPTAPILGHSTLLAVDGTKEYRVKSGDNLHRIAIKLYGKISMVGPIYDANKVTIGPDMAKLKLGMLLKLPEAPTVKQ